MIKFEPSKLRAVYVYILKVTTDYIYVASHRNGESYAPHGAQFIEYKGRRVSRIKIHRSVSHSFFKFNAMKEFSQPRLASLNHYGSDVIGVEIQMYNSRLKGYQSAENWKSNFAQVASQVEPLIAADNATDAWINGSEIFWVKERNTYSISTDQSFVICQVSYVPLQRMGLSLLQKDNTRLEVEASKISDEQERIKLLEEQDTKAELRISSGSVLRYRPNAAHPDEEDISVYSPVLKSNFFNDKPGKDEVREVYMLNSKNNPCYPNIEFALRAAKSIGQLYGHEATDFLDIPSIIVRSGEVNLHEISQSSRESVPLDMLATDCIAWIFSFIYKEDKLDNMRELSSMFRFILSKGLVYQNKIQSTFHEGVSEKDIPLLDASFINRNVATNQILS